MKKILAAAVGLVGSSAVLFGTTALADSANFDASATILEAITVTKTADLEFANIAPDAVTAGTVAISAAGVRTCDPVLTCSGTAAAAAFDVTGATGAAFTVTLPAAANITSGGDNMLVDNFTTSLPGNAGTFFGGAANFTLGGTLNVGAAQAAGAYTGSFTVTVEYN
ncbi:MAG: DUF4402 domain-containing protein [Parvularculaceae bacterium]|nr:DUF4402 domain-containing protein [Parvularculaceae bacterium]